MSVCVCVCACARVCMRLNFARMSTTSTMQFYGKSTTAIVSYTHCVIVIGPIATGVLFIALTRTQIIALGCNRCRTLIRTGGCGITPG